MEYQLDMRDLFFPRLIGDWGIWPMKSLFCNYSSRNSHDHLWHAKFMYMAFSWTIKSHWIKHISFALQSTKHKLALKELMVLDYDIQSLKQQFRWPVSKECWLGTHASVLFLHREREREQWPWCGNELKLFLVSWQICIFKWKKAKP